MHPVDKVSRALVSRLRDGNGLMGGIVLRWHRMAYSMYVVNDTLHNTSIVLGPFNQNITITQPCEKTSQLFFSLKSKPPYLYMRYSSFKSNVSECTCVQAADLQYQTTFVRHRC